MAFGVFILKGFSAGRVSVAVASLACYYMPTIIAVMLNLFLFQVFCLGSCNTAMDTRRASCVNISYSNATESAPLIAVDNVHYPRWKDLGQNAWSCSYCLSTERQSMQKQLKSQVIDPDAESRREHGPSQQRSLYHVSRIMTATCLRISWELSGSLCQ